MFSKDEIAKAIENVSLRERVYNPSTQIVRKSETGRDSFRKSKLSGKVLFIARGNVIEKDGNMEGELEEKLEPHLRFKRGNFACL